jgi:hypothetical protein
MASGCIIGDCPICNYPVYEDEGSPTGYLKFGRYVHIGECLRRYEIERKHSSEVRSLKKEIKELHQQIKWYRNENDELRDQVIKIQEDELCKRP